MTGSLDEGVDDICDGNMEGVDGIFEAEMGEDTEEIVEGVDGGVEEVEFFEDEVREAIEKSFLLLTLLCLKSKTGVSGGLRMGFRKGNGAGLNIPNPFI